MTERIPRGIPTKSGRLQIAVRFEAPLFDRILRMSRAEGKGFSDMVNELCKIGIFDLEESDALEPGAATRPPINQTP